MHPALLSVLILGSGLANSPPIQAHKSGQETAQITEPPELRQVFEPSWSPSLLAPGESREVKLQITIEIDGSVSRAEVVQSAGVALDWAALGSTTRLLFKPAKFNGEIGRAQVLFKLRFEREQQARGPPKADATRKRPLGKVSNAQKGEPEPDHDSVLRGTVRHAGTMRTIAGAEVALLKATQPKKTVPDSAGEDDKGEVDDEESAADRTRESTKDDQSESVVALTFSDAEGHFRFQVPAGEYTLDVRAANYEAHTSAQTLGKTEFSDVVVALYPSGPNGFETLVRAKRSGAAVSRVSLSREEVSGIPGTFGDPLRVVESLPGVARVPFFGGALIVRGGPPGSSAIFFDGVPIPVLYHFGAFASVINGSFLSQIDFEAGGFGAEYGRATAAVLNIRSHELGFDAWQGSMDVDFQDTSFFIGGPIRVGQLPRVDVAVAARRSYLEVPGGLALSALQLAGIDVPFLPIPVYSDLQMTAEVRPFSGHRLRIFAFGSEDHFTTVGREPNNFLNDQGFDDLDDYSFEELLNQALGTWFWRLVGEYEFTPLRGIKNTVRPFVGATKLGLLSNGIVVQAFSGLPLTTPERTIDWGIRDEFEVNLLSWLRLVAGVDHVGRTVNMKLGEPFLSAVPDCSQQDLDLGLCDPLSRLSGFNIEGTMVSTALYASATLGPISGVTIVPGVRLETTSLLFRETLGTIAYPPQANSEANSGENAGRQVRSWWSADPRVALRYEPVVGLAFKAAFGSYRQPPKPEVVVLQTGRAFIDTPRAIHVIAGLEAELILKLGIDLQLFGVRRDFLEQDESRRFGAPQGGFPSFLSQPGSFNSEGRGNTYGFSMLLRQQPTRWLFGWVSYTFSRTWLDVGEERDPFHPAPFDSTHNLVAVGKLNLWWGFTFGGRFQFTTGAPSPIRDSTAVLHRLQDNSFSPVPGGIRRPRLPNYHRLDLRLDKKWTCDSFSVTSYLEVLNVYNYPNTELAAPGGDPRGRDLVPLVPGVPFLPVAGLAAAF